jgi:acetyltransferase-like isoleucine patch superfamily enzyme
MNHGSPRCSKRCLNRRLTIRCARNGGGIVTKIEKVIRALRAALRLRGHLKRHAFVGPSVSLNIAAGAICEIGDRASIGRGCGIAVGSGARLTIGDHTDIQPNTSINAFAGVEIGSHCAISWHVDIIDDDFHTLVPLGGGHPARANPHLRSSLDRHRRQDPERCNDRGRQRRGGRRGRHQVVSAAFVDWRRSCPKYRRNCRLALRS